MFFLRKIYFLIQASNKEKRIGISSVWAVTNIGCSCHRKKPIMGNSDINPGTSITAWKVVGKAE
jgi:hypothetical protein